MDSVFADVDVAVAQFAAGTDKDANLETIRTLAAEAAAAGARVVVTPEYAMFATPKLDDRVVAAAESLTGPFVTRLHEIAVENDIYVVAGMAEEVPGENRVHNTLVAVSPAGTVAHYRKLHLYDAFGFRESDVVRPGEIVDPQTFTIDDVTFGLQTCYDVRFPEVTRRIVDAGAHVVLLAAMWIPGPLKEDHWTTLIRARAIENTVYVAAADQPAPFGAGNSMIVDPMGVTLCSMGEQTGVRTASVSRARIDAVRVRNPCLKLRRLG